MQTRDIMRENNLQQTPKLHKKGLKRPTLLQNRCWQNYSLELLSDRIDNKQINNAIEHAFVRWSLPYLQGLHILERSSTFVVSKRGAAISLEQVFHFVTALSRTITWVTFTLESIWKFRSKLKMSKFSFRKCKKRKTEC